MVGRIQDRLIDWLRYRVSFNVHFFLSFLKARIISVCYPYLALELVLFLKFLNYFIKCTSVLLVRVSVCTPLCSVPMEPRRGHMRSPGMEFTDACEPPHGWWELSPSPLKVQPALSASQTSLQSQFSRCAYLKWGLLKKVFLVDVRGKLDLDGAQKRGR